MVGTTVGVLTIAFACGTAYSQSAPAQPEFEVASIKPSPPTTPGMRMRIGMRGGPGTEDPGLLTGWKVSLMNLIGSAYDLKPYQISGPDWMNGTQFDFSAKVPAGATKEQFRQMLQNLLADRFKLVVHHEAKEMPVYSLVVGKNGPKLKESGGDPATARRDGPPAPAGPPGPPKIDGNGYPVLPAGRGGMVMMNGRVVMRRIHDSMEQFAGMLANMLGRPVTDATGLKGRYDFELYWSGRGMGPMMPGAPPPPPAPPGAEGPVPAASDDSGPTLIGAVQEQLGLRLEQKKGSVDTVVVDHAEKVPTEN